jgi:hypothetical protein
MLNDWVFQLNGDVTGNVCRADIDLLDAGALVVWA